MNNPKRNAILDLWATGATATTVARELGITKGSVVGVIHRTPASDPRLARRSTLNGLGRRPPTDFSERETRVLDAWQSGARLREIADARGLSVAVVANTLHLARRRGDPRAVRRRTVLARADVTAQGASP